MNLPIARYRFNCTLHDDLQLPFFSGSALRGVFGHMLRKTTCMTRQQSCTGCPLRQTCPYSIVFEPLPAVNSSIKAEQTPPAYIIEPPPLGTKDLRAGDTFQFQMVLLGDARQQLALIVYVWEQVLARGIRSPAGKGQLLSVEYFADNETSTQIYSRNAPLIAHQATLTIPSAPTADICNISFVTPTRVRANGKKVNASNIELSTLLHAIERRVRLLQKQFNWQPLAQIPEVPTNLKYNQAKLHWQDWVRYSSRQDQEMVLGGLLGDWQLSFDELRAWWPLLYVGQWLHVGKNASFGMGHYQLHFDNEQNWADSA